MDTIEIEQEIIRTKKFIPPWRLYKKPYNWSFINSILKRCRDKEIDVVEYFNQLDESDKERFLKGCVNLYGKFFEGKKLKNQLIESQSIESIWKKHSNHQLSEMIKDLDFNIKEFKQKLRCRNEIIKNHEKGMRGVIERNMELQYIINNEKKVNEILKDRLKKFEQILSGGITKKTK